MKNIDLPADGACQAGSREDKISSLQSSLPELWPSKVLVSLFLYPSAGCI